MDNQNPIELTLDATRDFSWLRIVGEDADGNEIVVSIPVFLPVVATEIAWNAILKMETISTGAALPAAADGNDGPLLLGNETPEQQCAQCGGTFQNHYPHCPVAWQWMRKDDE